MKNLPAMQETQETRFDPWVGMIPWMRKWLPPPGDLPDPGTEPTSLAFQVDSLPLS